jgi:hypothetical protein
VVLLDLALAFLVDPRYSQDPNAANVPASSARCLAQARRKPGEIFHAIPSRAASEEYFLMVIAT